MVGNVNISFARLLSILLATAALSTVAIDSVVIAAGQEAKRTEDVSFTSTRDGSTQRYVLIYPAGFDAKKSRDLLIALHGHGSDRWQFATDTRDETRAARDVAEKHQFLFVSPDYRARTSWMGPAAEADVVQIIQELKQRFEIDRTFLCGGSMGGASSLTFAALHPELIDGVASMNGLANHFEFERFQPEIAASFGGSKAEVPEEYKRRSAEFWPERFTMPVAFTVGGKDDIVPPQSVLRLAGALDRLQPNVLVINRLETGHTTSYEDGVAILEFVIGKATNRSSAAGSD